MKVLLLSMTLPLMAADGFLSLMPKREIAEHWTAEGAPASIWTLKDGVIACAGKPDGFLRSRKEYKNFILRAEWRFETEGWAAKPPEWPNAGFFIHAREIMNRWPTSIEVQGHYGQAGSMFGVRGGKISGAKRGPHVAERPGFGTWERYEVTSTDGTVKVVLNGKLVNEGAGAFPVSGNICLQSEGWPVFYRNVEVKEIP